MGRSMADVDVLARLIGFAGLGLAAYSFFANRRTARLTTLKGVQAKIEQLKTRNAKRAGLLKKFKSLAAPKCFPNVEIVDLINGVETIDSDLAKMASGVRADMRKMSNRIFGISEYKMYLIESDLDRIGTIFSIQDDSILDAYEKAKAVFEAAPCLKSGADQGSPVEK
jgi:hypothetical protein